MYHAWAPIGMRKRCPHALIEPESNIAVGWYHEYKRLRVLPFCGRDLLKQPAYVYEAIRAVDDAIIETKAEKQQADEAAQPRPPSGAEELMAKLQAERKKQGR